MTGQRLVGTTIVFVLTAGLGAAAVAQPVTDVGKRAFYYVRVLEIPTPRWTTYDAVFYGLDLPDGVPATQQDRAYTSPIWYAP